MLFIGLSSTGREAAERYVTKAGFDWPNGYGAKETIDELCGGRPMIFVIGREGRIRWTDSGSQYMHNFWQVQRGLSVAIEKALGEVD